MSFKEKFQVKNQILREFLAELLGTFILVSFGDGAVAQHVLGPLTGNPVFGNFHSVAAAWGLAIAMGVWVSGGVSGGHINPAVTLTMALIGRLPKVKVLPYMCAQYIGAFLASACIYGVYYDALAFACNADENGDYKNVTGSCATAGIYASYPSGTWLSNGGAAGDQLFATFLIMICIMAITDSKNMKPPKGMIPLCVGLIFFVIGLSYGLNVGFPVNPARDFAPRLFTLIAGYGSETFSAYEYYFWIPWIIPHIGMYIGALTYLIFIENHEPETDDDSIHQLELNSVTGTNGQVNKGFDQK